MQKRTPLRDRFPMSASRAVRSGASTLYTFSRRGFFSGLLVGQIEQELSEQKGVSVTSTHLHMNGFCMQCQTESRESRDRAKRQVLE